jgi:hypothetical protein
MFNERQLMQNSDRNAFNPRIERMHYEPRPAADVLFDPPPFPQAPKVSEETDEQPTTSNAC